MGHGGHAGVLGRVCPGSNQAGWQSQPTQSNPNELNLPPPFPFPPLLPHTLNIHLNAFSEKIYPRTRTPTSISKDHEEWVSLKNFMLLGGGQINLQSTATGVHQPLQSIGVKPITLLLDTLLNLQILYLTWYSFLGLYGVKKCRDEKLPLPLALCQVGIALVGIGSFLFHATLRYEYQLGDELPMIFCCAFITYVAFDTGSASLPSTKFVKALPYILFLYSFVVSAIYLKYPNPVFHQIAYATIQLVATFRSAYTVRNAPEGTYREQKNRADAIRYLMIGSVTFTTGFLIWNIDNLLAFITLFLSNLDVNVSPLNRFCDRISHLKEYLGTPWSFILEGHAWWHLATGTGSYLIVVGLQLVSLSLKEGADGFEIKRGGVLGLCPYVARIPIKIDPKLH
ncbi:hypothetical protein PSTT_04450 [Puccinia striiformis]|uniref:Alkaline ceramidase 3 n=1 Tax=Puccinia striiformis TaxID=27350 RepID=A0A2S4VSH9_9BASI|nr:hypothetical protein PSTT_04450 [Puccinia striiformis]